MRKTMIGLAMALLALTVPASAQTPPEGGYTGPLFPAGEPAVAGGEIGKGGAILTVPVRFSFTGVLEAPVTPVGWFVKDEPLPAGQPMFAMIYGRMWRPDADAVVVWCTHRKAPSKSEPNRWKTICLPKTQVGTYLWTEPFTLLPFRLSSDRSDNSVRPPTVKAGPADFGVPMIFSYRLLEFDAKDADINLYLSVDGYETWIGQTNLPRQADGSVVMPILGGAVRLVPTGKKTARAEVIAPLSASSPNLLLPVR